jgi:lipopolysaccharide export system protein LptC
MDSQTNRLAEPMADEAARVVKESGERRAKAFRKAHRHSRFVRLLRASIPVGSFAAVAGSLVILVGARMAEVPPIIDPARAGIENGRITMQDPRLLGFQKDNRSYQVTADKARQEVKTPNLVELASPFAKVETQTAIFAHIKAVSGLFDTKGETLQLDREISIRTDDGYTLSLQDARIDMKHGGLVSDKAVQLQMQNGRIDAKSIDLKDNGAEVQFSGGVTSEFTNLFGTVPASKSNAEAVPGAAQ